MSSNTAHFCLRFKNLTLPFTGGIFPLQNSLLTEEFTQTVSKPRPKEPLPKFNTVTKQCDDEIKGEK